MIMSRQTVLHFYPERIAWYGIALLGTLTLLAMPFLWIIQKNEIVTLIQGERRNKNAELQPCSFSLGLSNTSLGFSIPDLKDKMTFSFDPPRPDEVFADKRVLVRMKETKENKRIVLPCRLDLEFRENQLSLSQKTSPFWVDLVLLPNGQIDAKGWILMADGSNIDAGHFQITGQECPLQSAHEFPKGSPFRLLAEAEWWGRDLLRVPGESGGERIEIGELLEIGENDWLVYRENKWVKAQVPEKNAPIARIQSLTSKMLILEAWDLEGHTRFGLNLTLGPPFKMRGEDLLSSIRIRSEKQISCMLEKQCLILKTGDWVLKTEGRWKILRKKEERDAVFNGKLYGELFILEQISQKQGQKVIQGRLFNPGRTQVVSIEMLVQQGRKLKSGRQP